MTKPDVSYQEMIVHLENEFHNLDGMIKKHKKIAEKTLSILYRLIQN